MPYRCSFLSDYYCRSGTTISNFPVYIPSNGGDKRVSVVYDPSVMQYLQLSCLTPQSHGLHSDRDGESRMVPVQ